MSSPQAPNSPARSQTSDSHANVRDAFAGLPALPALPVEGLGENPGVDNPLDWVPNSSARLDNLDPHIGVFDAFAGLSELPIDNFGQFNYAGHHEQANDRDSHSIVRDAFATLPAVPNDNFGFDFGAVGPFNFDEHADFTGNHDNADFIPTDFELGLQRALASAQEHIGDFAPTFDEFNAHPPQVPDNSGPDGDFDPEQLLACFRSGALSPGQQAGAVDGLAEQNMDSVYRALMRENGFQPVQYAGPVDAPVAKPTAMPSATPAAGPAAPPSNTLTEHNYVPIAWEPEYDEDEDPDTPMDPNTPVDPIIPVDPNAPPPPPPPQPIYPAFTAKFQTGPEARAYRKRNRVPRKSQAPDIERVKRYGRMYWVRRIYECMIDITNVSDSAGSIHRARFMVEPAFDPLDLEAAAHHVFDEALAVHERGWVRPIIYHKKVVRGKLTDVSEKCLERRLARICLCLQQKKATVDDALRGGVTLALLCDNPEARGFTKLSNNAGNAKRGERLRAAKLLVVEDSEDERQRP